MKEKGIIASYQKKPTLSIPGYEYTQYNPDYLIELPTKQFLIIDNTTTVRTDRLKQKLWEAYSLKTAIHKAMYYVVVPNKDDIGTQDSREKEWSFVIKERSKLNNPSYFSAIDALLSLEELRNQLTKTIFHTVD